MPTKLTLKAEKYLPGFALVTVNHRKKELIAFVAPVALLSDNEHLMAIISQLFDNRKVACYGL